MAAQQQDPSRDPGETQDLLVRFREGDALAFDELVGEYERRLVQFFYRLCWDRGRSEDLTQNLFLKLLRNADRYRPEGKLATFIFRVATNLWIDQYRSERPRQRLFSVDQAMLGHERPPRQDHEPLTPAESVERDEEKARMRAALENLTEPHRLVFELAIYQELPYAEIGRILDIPVGTVKSRMHNSVKALRDMLNPDGQDRRQEEERRGGDVGGVAPRPFQAGGTA